MDQSLPSAKRTARLNPSCSQSKETRQLGRNVTSPNALGNLIEVTVPNRNRIPGFQSVPGSKPERQTYCQEIETHKLVAVGDRVDDSGAWLGIGTLLLLVVLLEQGLEVPSVAQALAWVSPGRVSHVLMAHSIPTSGNLSSRAHQNLLTPF